MKINRTTFIILSIYLLTVLSLSSVLNAVDTDVDSSKNMYDTDYALFYLDNRGMLNEADGIVNQTRSLLIELLNDSLNYKPDIHIVGNLTRFNELVSSKFPDWGAAAAIPELRRIIIKSPEKFNLNKSLQELLAHEYAHLVIAKKSWISYPPRWLNEGIAMYVSMEWSWSDNLALSKAAVFGQFIPLQEIEQMNRFNQSKVHIAYAQSYLAVDYLRRNYTDRVIEQLLKEIADGRNYNDALYNVTGLTIDEFESDFKIYLNQRFNVLSLFMDTIWLWLFLSVVVIVGFILKYKKRREYYKKWEDEEKLHSTDFDFGDPDRPEKIDDDDEAWRS